MNHSYPVYTAEAECQDCYKCVRHCPVKAIKVRDGHAAVIPELCVACGKCVEVCPVKAKRFRNDTARLLKLLSEPQPVYVSLAPSWVSEFKEVKPAQLIRALKALGFAGVSETALGAQIVSAEVAKELNGSKPGLLLSSACPTAVDFVRKYIPHLTGTITQVGSPLMAHCRMLRDTYGDDIRVVFIGPCISKKNEADRNPKLLDLAITYPELRQLLREANLQAERLETNAEDKFVPESAEEGALYPVEGGMNDTIQFQCKNRKVHYFTLTGLDNMKLALEGLGLDEVPQDETVFIETLACPGGCVHGPCTEHDSPGLLERLRVLGKTSFPAAPRERTTHGSIAAAYPKDAVPVETPTVSDIQAALRSIGKTKPEDELNCDSCGYDTCRNFAQALIAGHAEPSMCVSFLKKQAQKKANALLRSMSSGAVIVDRNMQIIECNRHFAELFGEETVAAFDACPGMAGADLTRIVPFSSLFESSLLSGKDIRRDSLKFDKRLFNVNIFTVDPGEVVGGVVYDVTSTELRREQIAARAREVIDRNIAAVQEIACRLGEQMADTELLLRSIADNYADDPNPAEQEKP